MIEEVRDELLVGIKWIRGACSNRKFRRRYGIKENFAETIPTYEKYLEVLEKKELPSQKDDYKYSIYSINHF